MFERLVLFSLDYSNLIFYHDFPSLFFCYGFLSTAIALCIAKQWRKVL